MKPLRVLSTLFGKGIKRSAERRGEAAGNQMSLVSHVVELRTHAVRGVSWLLGFCVLALVFMEDIVSFLQRPFDAYQAAHGKTEKLMSIGVFEVVTMNFKIALLVGVVFAVPFIIRELWLFVSPALYDHERRVALPVTIASVGMFFLGIAFGFYVIIPSFLSNLLDWASKYANVVLTFEHYFNSIAIMALLFGIIFEVPVILSLLGIAGIVHSSMIAKNRRIVILISFVVGAVLSPPDVFSQVLVSVPLYVMCELSVFSLRLIEKNREKRNAELAVVETSSATGA